MKNSNQLPQRWINVLLFVAALLFSSKIHAEKNITTSKEILSPDTIPTLQVNGKVVDQLNRPIIGATVRLRGTNKGGQTDNAGEFKLYDVMINSQLIVSSVGFATRQISLKKNPSLTIILDSAISEMKPVDVHFTGYQNLPKERSTGSFEKTNMEMYELRPSTDPISRMEGITPGLLVTRMANGLPGLSIRGTSTINANSDVLIIVDNFPYEGDINNINPNDIQSITLLKDAAAASIWGSRSGNGVIVITTKKGLYNTKMKINLYSNVTIQGKTQSSQSRDFINSSDHIDLESYLFSKGHYTADLNNTLGQPPISEVVEIRDRESRGLLTQQEAAAQIDLLRKNDVRKEFEKYFYRQVLRQQYGINLSGGLSTANYLISIGYDKNKESRIGDDFRRFTIRSATSIKLSNRFQLITDINYITGQSAINLAHANTLVSGDGKRISPYTKFTDDNGTPISIIKDYRKGYTTSGQNWRLPNRDYYPIYERDFSDNKTKQSEIRINMGLNSRISRSLTMDIQYQYKKANADNRIYYSPESYHVSKEVARFASIPPDGPITYNMPRGAQLDLSTNLLIAQNLRAKLNLDRSWNANVLSAILGFDMQESDLTKSRNYMYGYNNNTGSKSNVRYDSAYSVTPFGTEYIIDYSSGISGDINRSRAFFLNASYTYNNKYTATISGRIDQANIFGVRANQKSTPLWSTGVMWNLRNEFFSETKWLHTFQLRTTLGINANRLNNVTAYTTGTLFATSTPTQPPYASIQAPGNPGITWEKIKILNFGLDFNILNHLTGSLEFYRKKGIDLIGIVPLASSSGFINIMHNYASIKGSGVDILLNILDVGNTVKLSTSFNFSYTTDKVTDYVGDPNLQVGKPIKSLYSLKWAGLDSSGNPQGYLKGNVSKAYTSLINTPIEDKVFNGSINPKIYGGLTNMVKWENLCAYVNVQYKMGYYFRKTSVSYDNLFRRGIAHEDYINRWQKPGDEKITNVPSLQYPVSPGRDAYYNESEALIAKGDHIRLQDAGISYSLTRQTYKNLPFTNVQLSLNVSNIGIIWRANHAKIDPDYQQIIPPSIAYSAGLKVTL